MPVFLWFSPCILMVERWIMPEEVRWNSRISRRCFAPWCVPLSFQWGHPMIAGSTRFITVKCGACRRRYDVVPVDTGVQAVATLGLKSRSVSKRFYYRHPLSIFHSFLSLQASAKALKIQDMMHRCQIKMFWCVSPSVCLNDGSVFHNNIYVIYVSLVKAGGKNCIVV